MPPPPFFDELSWHFHISLLRPFAITLHFLADIFTPLAFHAIDSASAFAADAAIAFADDADAS